MALIDQIVHEPTAEEVEDFFRLQNRTLYARGFKNAYEQVWHALEELPHENFEDFTNVAKAFRNLLVMYEAFKCANRNL